MDIRLAFERYWEETGSKKQALYESLREAVRGGQLREGERLPSSRQLAELYGLSRGTVTQVYDMLYAEGYVQGERGRGTYVSERIPGPGAKRDEGGEERAERGSEWIKRLEAARGPQQMDSASDLPDESVGRAAGRQLFLSGQTDFRLFPVGQWKNCLHEAVRECMQEKESDGFRALPGAGSYRLREAIAAMLHRERALPVSPEAIIVTGGSKQALALILQVLAESGRSIVIEDPSYGGIRDAASVTGATLIHALVDEEGVIPEDWNADLAVLTPNRQFPTGAILSASRRKELLAWANRRNAVIIEDDYDSEFLYSGRPGEPLRAMDRSGRVVYIGSFSRTMYSGLRIGYAVVPEWLVPRLLLAKTFYEPYASGQLEQLALAKFLSDGYYGRHIRRMKRQYRKRLAMLHQGLNALDGAPFRFRPSDAGLHQFAVWSGDRDVYERFLERCSMRGAAWSDGGRYEHGGESGTRGLGRDRHPSSSCQPEHEQQLEEWQQEQEDLQQEQEKRQQQQEERQQEQGEWQQEQEDSQQQLEEWQQEQQQRQEERQQQGQGSRSSTALFGFAHLDEEEIREGMSILAEVWKEIKG